MKTPRKSIHKIKFTDVRDIECVVLAQLGWSTAAILAEVDLTKCQIAYRLTKAKNADGYEKGHTYRSEWRNGTSRVARAVMSQWLSPLRTACLRRMKGKFE